MTREPRVKIAAGIWRAFTDLAGAMHRAHADQRAQRQDLKEMASRAQRGGAVLAKRFGPAVFFYRLVGDRVECCFAEYIP
jgi:hypothetical protein